MHNWPGSYASLDFAATTDASQMNGRRAMAEEERTPEAHIQILTQIVWAAVPHGSEIKSVALL